MLKIDININGLDKLDKHIEFVNKMLGMKTDREFQKYIQNKCLETVKEVARTRLGGTTNDEYIEEYILRNKIREIVGGFELYNDFTIPAILTTRNTKNQDREAGGIVRNYDNGFSIALAFEYGVGIVGRDNPVQGAWDYNINNYGDEGWYYKPPSGESIRTQGYKGAEVYRYTAIEINKRLKDWVNSYYNSKKGA